MDCEDLNLQMDDKIYKTCGSFYNFDSVQFYMIREIIKPNLTKKF